MKNNKNINNNKNGNMVEKITKVFSENNKKTIKSDVDGSYTGTSENGEQPVQDSDDI